MLLVSVLLELLHRVCPQHPYHPQWLTAASEVLMLGVGTFCKQLLACAWVYMTQPDGHDRQCLLLVVSMKHCHCIGSCNLKVSVAASAITAMIKRFCLVQEPLMSLCMATRSTNQHLHHHMTFCTNGVMFTCLRRCDNMGSLRYCWYVHDNYNLATHVVRAADSVEVCLL